ncbi:MAG TPA: hydantoinase B/oxoprolinase family protein [Candidatus Saccharimonadia bacterium]|nr:hydantoinase B/oxoprolinase family protein [Candidatus Saccharimonadia bacterium]
MGSHLNHMIFTLPIFYDGEIVAFSASMAHRPDLGGVFGGVTRGIYAEGLQLPDGVVLGKHISVRIRVEVQGDAITFDLSGVGAQVAGYFNSGPTAGRSACEVAFKCLTAPLLLPINEASFRPLTIVLPLGRVVSATKPAALRWWMTIPQTEEIERTAHRFLAILERMPIDHGGADIFVAEQFLYGTNVIATFQEMGRKAMSQSFATAALLHTRSA